MSLAFRIINPLVRTVLRSPVHGLLSQNTVLLAFKGRRSGRQFCIPVSYRQVDAQQLHCFTAKDGVWWRNLTNGATVSVRLRGRWLSAKPTVVTSPPERVEDALAGFLAAVPRDAPHSGVRMDQGIPLARDIATAAPRHVLIELALSEDS